MAEGSAGGCDCKVGSAVDRFGLDGLDAQLAEEWTGSEGQACGC